jgi:hypothetical protein
VTVLSLVELGRLASIRVDKAKEAKASAEHIVQAAETAVRERMTRGDRGALLRHCMVHSIDRRRVSFRRWRFSGSASVRLRRKLLPRHLADNGVSPKKMFGGIEECSGACARSRKASDAEVEKQCRR